jgi:hypothetical protein
MPPERVNLSIWDELAATGLFKPLTNGGARFIVKRSYAPALVGHRQQDGGECVLIFGRQRARLCDSFFEEFGHGTIIS